MHHIRPTRQDRARTGLSPIASPRPPRSFLFVPEAPRQHYIVEACTEALTGANRLTRGKAYTWSMHSSRRIAERAPRYCLILIGAHDRPWRASPDIRTHLAAAMIRAHHVCLVGGAVFLHDLMATGGQSRLAVPPELRATFAETWPDHDIAPSTVVRDGRISSATGCAAALRLIVSLISEIEGRAVGCALAERLGLEDRVTPAAQSSLGAAASADPLLSRAVTLMNASLEQTLPMAELAGRLDISVRHLERRFRDRLGLTPLKAYRELQLARAYDLLTQTNLPILQVALASGFSESSLLSRWCRRRYGDTPAELRRRAVRGAPV